MSVTISLGRRSAAPAIRISASTITMATAAIATVSTIIGIATDADIFAYLSATIGLASLYTLDRKGGAK